MAAPFNTPTAVVLCASAEMTEPFPWELVAVPSSGLPDAVFEAVLPALLRSAEVPRVSGWVPACALGPGTVTPLAASRATAVGDAAPGSDAAATPATAITHLAATAMADLSRIVMLFLPRVGPRSRPPAVSIAAASEA